MKNLKEIGYDTYCATRCGRIYSIRSGKFLKPKLSTNGYHMVTLSQDGSRLEVSVHRLVARAYLSCDGLYKGVSVDHYVVNHIDFDKLNNSLDNLEYCTQLENVRHSVDGGRYSKINEYRPLSDAIVHQVCKLLDDGSRNKDISTLLGIPTETVSQIRAGIVYGDISDEYDFTKIPTKNRISESKVLGICLELSQGASVNKVRLKFSVSHLTVKSIKQRKTYTYISNNYDW